MNDKKSNVMPERICPRCGCSYRTIPATSREDNQTLICPDCGIREALAAISVPEDEIDAIIKIVHKSAKESE